MIISYTYMCDLCERYRQASIKCIVVFGALFVKSQDNMVNFLDLFITEIYKQFIVIKENEYRKSKRVFDCVFREVKEEMKKHCKFFERYSKQDMYAGSVYDRVKIGKMDEFDMDIVIKLPVNYDRIEMESEVPGFVKLKISEFDLLPKQKHWEDCHKVTFEWRDEEKYILQNKFRQWMHSIIQKALNELNYRVTIENVVYLIKYKESGPAYTLNIRNECGSDNFELDVDLVPVLKFQTPRWPGVYYRQIPYLDVKDWLVVPKPNKWEADETIRNRTWRLSFQEHERCIMKRGQHLKPTIRLLKKLRDSLKMDQIASYYIKTLFLWKINEVKEDFWRQNLSDLFGIMVKELFSAVNNKRIPYFWQEEYNLIKNISSTILISYSNKLKQVINYIDLNKIDCIVSCLLTKDELVRFQSSEFYKKFKYFNFNIVPGPSSSNSDESHGKTDVYLPNTRKMEYCDFSTDLEQSDDKPEVKVSNNNLDAVETDERDQHPPKESWTRPLKKALLSPILLMSLLSWSNNPSLLPRGNTSNEYVLPFKEHNQITSLNNSSMENINFVTYENVFDENNETDISEEKDISEKGQCEMEDFHELSDDDISW